MARKKTETQDQAERLRGLFSAGKTEGTEQKEEAPVKPKRTRQTTAKAETPAEPQAVTGEASKGTWYSPGMAYDPHKTVEGQTMKVHVAEIPAEATAEEEPKKPVKGRKKATEAPVKGKKAVMSCRVDADQLTAWRAYAQGAGVSLPTLLTAAVGEYMRRHKLTEGQLEAFKLRQKMKKV